MSDGFRLSAFLGADTGVCARRIDERDDGKAELLGQLHHAQCFAIAFGLRHAEVAVLPLLGIATFLVADHHHALPVEARQSADNGRIVGKRTVTVQLLEIGHDHADVIEAVGPLRMARHLRNLPSGQLGVDVFGERLAFLGQFVDFRGYVDGGIVLHVAKLLDFRFQFGDRLLEIEKIEFWCAHA